MAIKRSPANIHIPATQSNHGKRTLPGINIVVNPWVINKISLTIKDTANTIKAIFVKGIPNEEIPL
jgi:hypothetical protein